MNPPATEQLVREAVEAEREACARLCDRDNDWYGNASNPRAVEARYLANVIRDRGTK